MNDPEDKFFENLAKMGSDEESEVEVGLAKARLMPMSQPKAAPKKTEREFGGEPEGQLTIDVYQTPTEIVVESAVAGVSPDDLDISVSNESVTIRGERRREDEIKDGDYFYQECYWGRFSRSVILPQEIDLDNASVNFRNGILTVHLPKLNRQKSKKLKVKLE